MQMTEQGHIVYQRTYARTKPNGEKETWNETVERVVDGNLALGDSRHELPGERTDLIRMMQEFKILPAGRHLWASGVKGRQYLFNCWVAPWGEQVTEHFSFTFLRLMEGGGVGANYSNRYLDKYEEVRGWVWSALREADAAVNSSHPYQVHIVCDPDHPDYQKMHDAGVLSTEYVSDWEGCFEVDDSREGWSDALVDLIETYYRPTRNVNRVFDVSRVREEGARLKSFGGRASGPLPLAQMLHEVAEVLNRCVGSQLDGISAMEIDHAIAKCVVSGGNRRSARMSIMRWDDPQVFDFLIAKGVTGKHWTTNISVEVDDDFWSLVAGDDMGKPLYAPGFIGDASGVQHVSDVLDSVSDGMLVNGEPGIWNSSLSNVGEPNLVISTNPCGEIALEESENCNLGHVNLAAFVDPETGEIDGLDLRLAHKLVTRFLMRATNGDVNDPKSRELLDRNRRIGVGHLGVASFLGMSGVPYAEAPDEQWFVNMLDDLSYTVTKAARRYAHDLRIPVPVKTRTVAPTGTIAKLCGVSEGIHPIFSKYFIRRIRFSTVDPDQVATLDDYERRGYGVADDQYASMTKVVSLPTKDSLLDAVEKLHGEEVAEQVVQSAADLSLREMLAFQEMYQRHWADNAVSYTVNFDAGAYTAEEVASALTEFGPTLKGATLFPEMSMPQSPYERISKADYALYEMWSVGDGVDENCANGACPIK